MKTLWFRRLTGPSFLMVGLMCLCLGTVRSQVSLPTPGEITEKAEDLLSPLDRIEEEIDELEDELADDEDLEADARKDLERKLAKRKKDLQRARARFEALLRQLADEDKAWKEEHYIQVSFMCLRARRSLWSARAAELGLARLGATRFLLDNKGMAYVQLAVLTDDEDKLETWLSRAEEALLAAIKLKPDTFHAYFGMAEIHDLRGHPKKRLQSLKRALAFAEGRKKIPDWRYHLGELQLYFGKYKDCLETVDSPEARKVAEFEEKVLAIRAHALLGDKKKALSLALALEKGDPDDLRCVAVRADLMAQLGQRKEALALLEKRMPEKKKDGEGSPEEAQMRESLDCLLVLLRSEGKKGLDAESLRKDLIVALDHHVMMITPSSKGKLVNVGNHPAAMLFLLERSEESAKDWAEEVLRMLCQRALESYAANKDEKEFCKLVLKEEQRASFKDKQEHQDQRRYLRTAVSDPDFVGAFAARRLLELLR